MDCNCKYCNTILAIVILVFSFWSVAWTNWLTSKWIIVAAAVLILLHGIKCNHCGDRCGTKMPAKKKAKKKKK
jgi:predicted Na+-dependent transporter